MRSYLRLHEPIHVKFGVSFHHALLKYGRHTSVLYSMHMLLPSDLQGEFALHAIFLSHMEESCHTCTSIFFSLALCDVFLHIKLLHAYTYVITQ